MNALNPALREAIMGGDLVSLLLSDPVPGAPSPRARTRPLTIKGTIHYQVETFQGPKALQKNLLPADFLAWLDMNMDQYRQATIKTKNEDLVMARKRGGDWLVSARTALVAPVSIDLGHDRKKNYLLPKDQPTDFLIALGVQSPEGRIRKEHQDKFRQINRFLEHVEELADHLPKDRPVRILDFGCGKAYLSFALYHLLTVRHGRTVELTGLDLKSDVVAFCNATAQKLSMKGLVFREGDIAGYKVAEGQEPDMLVTLHACDTATDLALAEAIARKTKFILSVPCCQHELFGQIDAPALNPLLQHGLFKERLAALATDAIRVQIAETLGYRVQVLEFIDPEHTPKNIMLRMVRTEAADHPPKEDRLQAYLEFRNFLGASPSMEKALRERGLDLSLPLDGSWRL